MKKEYGIVWENKWMKQYGATRNQVRRILFGVEYNEALDGPEEEYEERKIKIGEKNER